MSGGTWTEQNKALPGVYTNFSARSAGKKGAVTGVVIMALVMSWYDEHKITAFTASDLKNLTSGTMPITEALKNAYKVLVYRLNAGTKATAELGNLVCTAKYGGAYGNKIMVEIEAVLGENGYYVNTYVDRKEADSQKVSDISELINNDYVAFSAKAEDKTLTATAGMPLTGGEDGAVTAEDYKSFLTAAETEQYNTMACITDDEEIKTLYVNYTKRMIENEGKYFQTVISNVNADYEGVISLQNGVVLANGNVINKTNAVAYVAGACASAKLTESLTNFEYQGAVNVDTRYTMSQQEAYARAGQMIFIADNDGTVHVQKDINTLVTLTEIKTYAFTKNKIIRTLFAIADKIKEISKEYIGKMPNNENSRELFRSAVYDYFRELEKSSVIQNASSADIEVTEGSSIDSIRVTYGIRPVDTIDIIYNSIEVTE